MKIMTIVNGFDIDTPEGATAYLESEGVDVEEYVRKGIAELKRTKALDLADVSDLLPCPFCGGKAEITTQHGLYFAMCENDECDIHPEAEAETKEECIEQWNKRK